MPDGTEMNLGATDTGNPENPGAGAPSATPGSTSTPANQGGQAPAAGSSEIEQLKAQHRKEVQALNRAVIEARRRNGQGVTPQGQGAEATDTSDPAAQYAMALQVATGEVRAKMEDVFDLYPELPADVTKQIRRNPWAFASQQSYQAGDVDAALLEIEQYIADKVESASQTAPAAPAAPASPIIPAQVNANPTPETAPAGDPGSDVDENLWTMPMDKLTALRNKTVAQKKSART